MVEFLAYLGKEGAVIADAPLIFLTALALAGGLISLALRWQYRARIEHRDDEIRDYKRRLDGATPEEAQAKMAALEKRLDELSNPRALTQDQITRLTNSLSGKPPWPVAISRDVSDVDSAKAQTQLIRAFKQMGWTVESFASTGVDNPPPCGLVVFTRTGDHRSLAELLALAALDAAGIAYDLRRKDRREKGVKVPELQIAFTDAEIE